MVRNTIKGNKALAEALGVHPNTVQGWRNEGVLAPATISDFRRTIIYDLDKVYECLNHQPLRTGRPAKQI